EFGRTGRLTLFAGLIALVILYEPLLVAFRGFTIGQQLSNVRVVAPTASGRLPLWKAFVRWLLKAGTGLGSFATMGATQRNQALHDLPFGTTVQIVNPALATARDFIEERVELPAGALPSPWRRLLVIGGYLFVLLALLTPVLEILASSDCIGGGRCTSGERVWIDIAASGWMAASVAVCIFGWKGKLPGARGRIIPEPGTERVGP
ncbi:MAG: RDD family protein, partial [Gemmatimonadales bacterium]